MDKNRVYLMDCLKGMEMIEDETIDLIVTDPPYFIENLKEDLKEQSLRKESKNNVFHAEWDSSFNDLQSFKVFMMRILSHFKRVLRDKGQVYMFMSYHHIEWLISLIKEYDFRFYKPLIWFKPDTMGLFPNQYGCNYEVMLWFRKKGKKNKVTLNIGCTQRDVFQMTSTNVTYRKECGFHPTCKPIKLIRQLVKNGSNEGDLVLDCFMGSGTTAVACKQLKRNFIGFETSEEYHKTIMERLTQTNLTEIFEDEYKDEIQSKCDSFENTI